MAQLTGQFTQMKSVGLIVSRLDLYAQAGGQFTNSLTFMWIQNSVFQSLFNERAVQVAPDCC